MTDVQVWQAIAGGLFIALVSEVVHGIAARRSQQVWAALVHHLVRESRASVPPVEVKAPDPQAVDAGLLKTCCCANHPHVITVRA